MANPQYAHWAWQYNTPGVKKLSSSVGDAFASIFGRRQSCRSRPSHRCCRGWSDNCGWILSRYAVGSDGRTGYARLKGREHTAGISIFGEANWYKLSKTADLTKLDDRWRTSIWLGKSDRSDEHIVGLQTGAVLARSARRKVEGKRWNEKALKMVTGTPWKPRPGDVVVRRTYITRALIERYGPTADCSGCFWESQHHSERCRARFELLCVGEDGPVEVRVQEEDPAAPNLASALTAVQAGSVQPVVMEPEDAGDEQPSACRSRPRQALCHGR